MYYLGVKGILFEAFMKAPKMMNSQKVEKHHFFYSGESQNPVLSTGYRVSGLRFSPE